MKPETVIAWHRTSDLAKAVHLLRQQGMTVSFPMRSTFAHQALELIPDLRSKHLSGLDQAGFLGMCPDRRASQKPYYIFMTAFVDPGRKVLLVQQLGYL